MNDRAQAVLDFWFDEMVAEKRFKKDKSFDELIKEVTSNEFPNLNINYSIQEIMNTTLGRISH